MDDYAREMMDLKTLVTRTLEKRGVLARIRAELRANVFAAIEEEDRALENEENPTFALLGSCNDRAKELHASPTGKLITALICDYLEWGQLEHTLKVYLPECNLPRGFWKSELKEKLGPIADSNSKDADRVPALVEIVESFLKQDQQNSTSNLTGSFAKLAVRRNPHESTSLDDSQSDSDKSNSNRRPLAGNLPPMGRKSGLTSIGQARNSGRNYDGNDQIEESASNEKRHFTRNMQSPEISGQVNDMSSAYGACTGSELDDDDDGEDEDEDDDDDDDDDDEKRSEDNLADQDAESSEKARVGDGIQSKTQCLSSFWRKNTSSVSLYDAASMESLEEVLEEEDASFEKESCSSAM